MGKIFPGPYINHFQLLRRKIEDSPNACWTGSASPTNRTIGRRMQRPRKEKGPTRSVASPANLSNICRITIIFRISWTNQRDEFIPDGKAESYTCKSRPLTLSRRQYLKSEESAESGARQKTHHIRFFTK